MLYEDQTYVQECRQLVKWGVQLVASEPPRAPGYYRWCNKIFQHGGGTRSAPGKCITSVVFITHCTTILRKKNPNASEGSVFLVTCMILISGSSAKCCLQAPHSFEPFCFPKTPFTSNLKLSKASFSSPWRRVSKYSSLIRSHICGLMEAPSFSFASFSLRDFSNK